MQLDERKSHPRIDLTGQRFDRLTVLGPAPIRRAPNGKTRRYRLCRCDCGAEIETRIDQLVHGITRSCGCLQRETAAEVARSRTTQKTLALREKRAERKTKGLRSNLGVRDLIGQRFGLLTVLEFAFVKKQKSFWACVCDCGDAAVVTASRLNFSDTKSCGCLQREQQTKHKEYNFKHGYAVGPRTPEYWSWCAMKQRCLNPNYQDYENYGGRGIGIHEPWIDSFEVFLAYVGLKPSRA